MIYRFGDSMKFILTIIFFLSLQILYAQDDVKRLPNEKIEEMVQRYFIEINLLNDSIEETSYNDWEIMHTPVELEFGYFKGKRIVVILYQNDDSYQMEVGLFTPIDNTNYRFEKFGEFNFGFPRTDSILSVFSYDIDGDEKKELMVLGKGEYRSFNEDGLTGCCETAYETHVYSESTAEYDPFRPESTPNLISNLKNANEVKAAYDRLKCSKNLVFSGTKDDFVKKYLNKLDSLDRTNKLIGERIIIDKIYELVFGTLNNKSIVVSFIQKTDNIEKYFTGIFEKNDEGTYRYIESHGIQFDDYSEFKNYKVESIFVYDAERALPKQNQLIILLSAKQKDDSNEKVYKSFVGFISYDHSRVTLQEGWHYGIYDERTAADIKKAIENYHNPKEDETPRD